MWGWSPFDVTVFFELRALELVTIVLILRSKPGPHFHELERVSGHDRGSYVFSLT